MTIPQTRVDLADGVQELIPAGGREAAAGMSSTPRVIGLDLSLTGTGVADNATGQITTGTIRTKPYGPALTDQWQRLQYIDHTIWRTIDSTTTPTLVAIEGPSYSSKGAGTWDRSGLWWTVVSGLLAQDIPIAVVPPAVLKKYGTGRGNADKTAMAVALQKRADLELKDDNQVDAWWLAAATLDHLGVPPVDMPKAQRDALDKVAWPELVIA